MHWLLAQRPAPAHAFPAACGGATAAGDTLRPCTGPPPRPARCAAEAPKKPGGEGAGGGPGGGGEENALAKGLQQFVPLLGMALLAMTLTNMNRDNAQVWGRGARGGRGVAWCEAGRGSRC